MTAMFDPSTTSVPMGKAEDCPKREGKVYCNQCVHQVDFSESDRYYMFFPQCNVLQCVDTPYQHTHQCRECRFKNANNNCPDFVKKPVLIAQKSWWSRLFGGCEVGHF